MQYVVGNGEVYVKQDVNGMFLVNDTKEATKWKLRKSAEGVHKSLSKSKKYTGYKFIVTQIEEEEKAVPKVNDVVETKNSQKEDKECNILNTMEDFLNFYESLKKRTTVLSEQIQKADLEISDIEHAAEFYTLNGVQGYKLYKLLHDIRIKRRVYKDELQAINIIMGTNGLDGDRLKKVTQAIAAQDKKKKYSPRVLTELFGEGKVGKL